MTEIWTPLCLVAACDLDSAVWPMPVAVVGADLSTSVAGATMGIDRLHPRLVAAVSLSKAGAKVLDLLEAQIATQGRSLADLRLESSPDQLAPALIARVSAALQASQGRVVKQMRELSQMRQLTETTLQHFERLEAFVWQTAKCERNQVLHLGLRQDDAELELTLAEQRLPVDSVGLSDVAIWIAGGQGDLTVALDLMESGQTVAEWRVSDPTPGWLRLALPRALSADAQTPILRLSGPGLRLGLSHDHPDPRFHCAGGAMLAVKLWKFIPATQAPLSPDSLAPAQGPARGRWLIGLSALAEAVHQAAAAGHIDFVEWAGGAVMRPEPGQTLTLRLPGMVRPGMVRLQGMASIQGAQAVAELAYATALPGQDPETITWQKLVSGEPDQIHAFPAPVLEPQDLILMARLAEDSDATPAVVFERIEAFADLTGHDSDGPR
jgi:hypothetical protein